MPKFILAILEAILPALLVAIQLVINNEAYVKLGDKLLDWVERAISEESDWYDEYVLELVKIIRNVLKIEDLPDVVE